MADLCTACMCSGRKLYFIGETGFYQLYSQILNEIHIYDMSELCIRVCWECRALLHRVETFKQQVKKSYMELLQYVQQNNSLQPLPESPRLQIQQVHNICYPLPEVKQEQEETHDVYIDNTLKTEPEPESVFEAESEEVVDVKLDKKRKKEAKKVAKQIKQKPNKNKKKTKLKTKSTPEKSPVKKKIKLKKIKSPSPEPKSETNYVDDDDGELPNDYVDVEIKQDGEEDMMKMEKQELENQRRNGHTEPEGVLLEEVIPKEVLPERPTCAECGKSFSSRKTYRYHLNVLHKGQNRYPCPRCGKVYQWKSNLGRHLRSHKARDSGELYCDVCDKRFASVATYRQHLRISKRHVTETEFNFMCNECGKKFVNKTRLRDHIDWEHLKKIKFRCQLCNKPFKCHTSLYVHMQNVHRNKEKKDNLCHVCGKSYQNAAKLKYHIVAMHTSETPYQCSQCSAAFGWYSSLYRHVREVHYKMKLQQKKTKKSKKCDNTPVIIPPIIPSILPQPTTLLAQLQHGQNI